MRQTQCRRAAPRCRCSCPRECRRPPPCLHDDGRVARQYCPCGAPPCGCTIVAPATNELRGSLSSSLAAAYDQYSRIGGAPHGQIICLATRPSSCRTRWGAAAFARATTSQRGPRDGTVFCLIDRGIRRRRSSMATNRRRRFDAVKFSWIGSIMRETGNGGRLRARSVVKTVEDARATRSSSARRPETDPAMFVRLVNESVAHQDQVIHG